MVMESRNRHETESNSGAMMRNVQSELKCPEESTNGKDECSADYATCPGEDLKVQKDTQTSGLLIS